MILQKRTLAKTLGAILATATCLLPVGCEQDDKPSDNTPAEEPRSAGSFESYAGFSEGIVHTGGHGEQSMTVKPNTRYNAVFTYSNDGGSDIIRVNANGVSGTIVTPNNPSGGRAWYNDLESSVYSFSSSDSKATFSYYVLRTDEYGTWVKGVKVAEAK